MQVKRNARGDPGFFVGRGALVSFGQSEAGYSNVSGTGLVRVTARLSSSTDRVNLPTYTVTSLVKRSLQ